MSNNWYCSNENCPLGKTRKCRKYKSFAPAGITDFRKCNFTTKDGKVICPYKQPYL
jgi:hypothetical protein